MNVKTIESVLMPTVNYFQLIDYNHGVSKKNEPYRKGLQKSKKHMKS